MQRRCMGHFRMVHVTGLAGSVGKNSGLGVYAYVYVLYIDTYVYVCIYINMCVYLCTYIYIHIYMCVYTCVYIYRLSADCQDMILSFAGLVSRHEAMALYEAALGMDQC